jgi:hypothetical protein
MFKVSQSFLSTKFDINGNSIKDFDDNWNIVKECVITACKNKNKDENFTCLALALAKYDYNGASSNWKYKHEETILAWTEWAFENSDAYNLEEIIQDYKNDLIPDAFDLLINYFT